MFKFKINPKMLNIGVMTATVLVNLLTLLNDHCKESVMKEEITKELLEKLSKKG